MTQKFLIKLPHNNFFLTTTLFMTLALLLSCTTVTTGTTARNNAQPPDAVIVNISTDEGLAQTPNTAPPVTTPFVGNLIRGIYFVDNRIRFTENLPANTFFIRVNPQQDTTITVYPARINTNAANPLGLTPRFDDRYQVAYSANARSGVVTLDTNDNNAVITFLKNPVPSETFDLRIALTPNPTHAESTHVEAITLGLRIMIYDNDADSRIKRTTLLDDFSLQDPLNIAKGIFTNLQASRADAKTNLSTRKGVFLNFVGSIGTFPLAVGSAYADIGGDLKTVRSLFQVNGRDTLEVVDPSTYMLYYKLEQDSALINIQRLFGLVVPTGSNFRAADMSTCATATEPLSDSFVYESGNDYYVQAAVLAKATCTIQTLYNFSITVAPDPTITAMELVDSSDMVVTTFTPGSANNAYTVDAAGEYSLRLAGRGDFYVLDETDAMLPSQPPPPVGDNRVFSFTMAAGSTMRFKVINMIESSLAKRAASCQAIKASYLTFSAPSLLELTDSSCYLYEGESPTIIALTAN